MRLRHVAFALVLLASPRAAAEERPPLAAPHATGFVPTGLSTFVLAALFTAAGVVIPRSEAAMTTGARELRPSTADAAARSTDFTAQTTPKPPPLYTTLVDLRF